MTTKEKIGSRIRGRREELKWSGVKLATMANVDQSFLSRLENGKTNGSPETLTRIMSAMGRGLQYLYQDESNVELVTLHYRAIPILEMHEVAEWLEAEKTGAPMKNIERIPVTVEHDPSTIAMRVKGDSMMPRYTEGDIIIVDPSRQVFPGALIVATDGDGNAIFRQYKLLGKDDAGLPVFELRPVNDFYPSIRSDREPLAIVGPVVEHRQKFGNP